MQSARFLDRWKGTYGLRWSSRQLCQEFETCVGAFVHVRGKSWVFWVSSHREVDRVVGLG